MGCETVISSNLVESWEILRGCLGLKCGFAILGDHDNVWGLREGKGVEE